MKETEKRIVMLKFDICTSVDWKHARVEHVWSPYPASRSVWQCLHVNVYM